MDKLSHFDDKGKIRMVDVSEKIESARIARASANVLMNSETLNAVRTSTNPKGDPLEIARIAGIMAAKKTSELIPLCHQIQLSRISIEITLTESGAQILAEAKTTAQTGVEMEALTAASVAALTIYDMCKAVQKNIEITDVRLEFKEGGKSGTYIRKQ